MFQCTHPASSQAFFFRSGMAGLCIQPKEPTKSHNKHHIVDMCTETATSALGRNICQKARRKSEDLGTLASTNSAVCTVIVEVSGRNTHRKYKSDFPKAPP